MAKEYFSHDYNSRSDPKLVKLLMKETALGLGIYWCIIEMLYEQNGKLPLCECETIAFEMRTECERIDRIIRSYDLFKFDDEFFYSESVLRRLEIRKETSDRNRKIAIEAWAKRKDKANDTNA